LTPASVLASLEKGPRLRGDITWEEALLTAWDGRWMWPKLLLPNSLDRTIDVKQTLLFIPALLLSMSLMSARPVKAMDSAEYGEFQKLMLTPLDQLTEKADKILSAKYERPDDSSASQDYMGYSGLPIFVLSSISSYVGYRIATVKPQLLAHYECYAACGNQKPRNLLECFLKAGKPGAYVDVAASCPVCYGEAISIFLWDEMGASMGEIIGGLRFLYDPSTREAPPL